MKDFPIGVHVNAPKVSAVIDNITAAEAAGIDIAWMTSGGAAPDPLAVFSAAAVTVPRIRFGTCIIPTFPRHPLAMIQGAVAVDQLAPGRLRLGIGPSHQTMIESTLGIPFERPLEHLREYLAILNAAATDGKVDFEGKRLTARVQLPAPLAIDVLASALRVNGFRVCGELAGGAISWMCPLPYLRDVAVPAMHEGAVKGGRKAPPLIAHVPLVVSEDREAAYAAARQQIGFYPRVPFYSQMLQDAGYPEAKDGELSDRMIDGLVAWGSASEVRDRIQAMPSFGVGELLAAPINPAGDPGARERTYALLGEMARG